MNKISIIIPVLNEEKTLPVLLEKLPSLYDPVNISQTIVVDGGSTDSTVRVLEGRNDVLLLHSGPGRAKQMNAGASAAGSDILYFLHADSVPPKHFDALILDKVRNGNRAGCFRLRFDYDHWWLNLAGWLTRFNWKICRGGDQSLFIKKSLFEQMGGYDEAFGIYEDNEMIGRLYKRDEFTVIQKSITTSARLYREIGIWRLQYHFWSIYLRKYFGAGPQELSRYYKKHISQ